MLAANRFTAMLGIFAFIAVTTVLARRIDSRFQAWSGWVLIGGIAAACLGHVAIRWRSFAEEPWRVIALWEGGFYWPTAAAAIVLLVLLALKTARLRVWSVLPLAAAVVIWDTAWQLAGGTQALPLPEAAFSTMAGEPLDLDAGTGKPKIINLWATWCPPCRREMPMISASSTRTSSISTAVCQRARVGSFSMPRNQEKEKSTMNRRELLAASAACGAGLLLPASFALAQSMPTVEQVLFDPEIPVLGNPDGDVTIAEFFDYQCPFCKSGHAELVDVVERDGQVRLVMKDWPIFGEPSVYVTCREKWGARNNAC